MGAKKVASTTVKTKKPSVAKAIRDKQTRIQILQTLSANTGLSKTQVESVFSNLSDLIEGHMKPRGSGEFTIPMTGVKLRRVKKKSTKPRTMTSPLTGQEVVIPAKPARSAIKLTALKVLKDTVA